MSKRPSCTQFLDKVYNYLLLPNIGFGLPLDSSS